MVSREDMPTILIDHAEQQVPEPAAWHVPGVCPRCGSETMIGYGFAGGGIGGYECCSDDACDWMVKSQDRD